MGYLLWPLVAFALVRAMFRIARSLERAEEQRNMRIVRNMKRRYKWRNLKR